MLPADSLQPAFIRGESSHSYVAFSSWRSKGLDVNAGLASSAVASSWIAGQGALELVLAEADAAL